MRLQGVAIGLKALHVKEELEELKEFMFFSPNSLVLGVLNSFLRCVRPSVIAGVRAFPLAMQHFYSFLSHVISLLLSPRFGHCLHFVLLLSLFVSGLVSFLLVTLSALSPFLLRSAMPTSALQPFTFVSQLWTALPCNPLHLSPSSRLLCPPVPCNPLHLSSQSFAFVSQL